MKKYIKSYVESPKYLLLIEVEFNNISDIFSTKDTEQYINPRDNLSKDKQYTVDQQLALNDLVRSIMSAIRSRGFEVKKHYQSTDTYSYYIHFKPKFYNGIEEMKKDENPDYEVVNVSFKIGDHHYITEEFTDEDNEQAVFRTIKINKEEYYTWDKILKQVIDICNDLQLGDYSKLLRIK